MSALKVFHQYLKEKKADEPQTKETKEKKADEPQTKETLANVLKLFYAEARKVDCISYSKSTLNICSGICIIKQLLGSVFA